MDSRKRSDARASIAGVRQQGRGAARITTWCVSPETRELLYELVRSGAALRWERDSKRSQVLRSRTLRQAARVLEFTIMGGLSIAALGAAVWAMIS